MNSLLDNLPDINFAEKDVATITAEVIARFEKDSGRTLFPGDPLRLLILTFIYYLSLQRSKIDFSGKQNLLRYAKDGFIQNIAALVGTTQLEPRPALTKLKFTISTTLPNPTLIPAGTRATPGNKIFFATTESVEIPAGELSIIADAECTQDGTIGNGFLPGQINRLTDTFRFNYSVENIEETHGGADTEEIEAFRERARMAPESFSTAGPYLSYVYWAKTANQLISDVEAKSPSPGVVNVVPLLEGGEIPSQSILDEVYRICSADQRRPLTDHVIVSAPEVVNFDIALTYYISRRNAAVGLNLQQAVEDAVQEYAFWQKSKLGRNIEPSMLVKMVRRVGVRVDLDTVLPEFKALEYFQIGIADMENAKITYGGLEDD